MTQEHFAALVPPHLRRFTEATPLEGSDMELLTIHNHLHLTEISMALGVNTAALYSKKSSQAALNSSVSILLRLYAALPEFLPHLELPSVPQLIAEIKKVEPNFLLYNLGPLLGLETNSSYRLRDEGFEGATQTTRVLAWLIYEILTKYPEKGWPIIKSVIETEAKARKIVPTSSVWRHGGWSRSLKKEKAKKAEVSSAAQSGGPATGTGSVDGAPSSTAKKLIRRRKPEGDDQGG